jgi:taurine transport system substrate-binding protein
MQSTRRALLISQAFALLALGLPVTGAAAQTKEVTFAHQDMIVPLRVLMAKGEIEKATGYKINWKMFGGGGDVIKAMASNEVPIGEVGSSPATAAASQGLDVQVIWLLDDIGNAEQLVARNGSGSQQPGGPEGQEGRDAVRLDGPLPAAGGPQRCQGQRQGCADPQHAPA